MQMPELFHQSTAVGELGERVAEGLPVEGYLGEAEVVLCPLEGGHIGEGSEQAPVSRRQSLDLHRFLQPAEAPIREAVAGEVGKVSPILLERTVLVCHCVLVVFREAGVA